MRRFARFRPSPAFVLAFIALLVALGGSATALQGANSVSKDDIRRGAVGKSEVRVDSIGKSELIENVITGGQVKESSLKGVQSAQGLTNWAQVSASGKLIEGSNVRTVFRFGSGGYNLFWTNDVSKCGHFTSLSSTGFGTAPPEGTASVNSSEDGPAPSSGPSVAQIRTRGLNGKFADQAFFVGAVC